MANNGFGSDDDLYVNAGDSYDTTYYPEEDMAVREAEVSQKALQAASFPILGDVAEWFEYQIKGCDNLDNIQFDRQNINGISVDRKLSVEAQVLAYRLLKELLSDKYDQFREFKHER
jgi:hypothetical protein